MPYNRYDIKNRYDYRGRRRNERVGLKTFFLFFTPVLIVAVIALGIFISWQIEESKRPSVDNISTADQVELVSDSELLVVVSDRKPLEEDYVPALVPFGGVSVSELLFDDLDDLISDAAAQGVKITVKTGYVSYSDQAVLYEETFNKIKSDNDYSEIKAESETKKICPEAGRSESQTGLLIQFSTSEEFESFDSTDAGKWLERNSVNYGFILRYPEDEDMSTGMAYAPDLYRYVGKEHALNIRRYDMTLEEYSSHISMR